MSLTVTRSSSSTEKLNQLWQGLHLTSTLTKLVVKGDPLNAEDMRFLSQGMANNSSIATLCLSRCGVDDDGLASFVHEWRHNSTIHTLDLSDNKISGTGALRLIQIASRHPCVQRLNLNANAIGIEGLVNIAFELPKIALKELKLASDPGICVSRNDSNDTSLHAILASKVVLQGLRDNKFLVAFDVSGHGFETFARGFQETLDSYLMRNRSIMMWSSPVPSTAFHLPRGIWSHVFGKFVPSDGVFLYFMWPQNGDRATTEPEMDHSKTFRSFSELEV